MSDTSEIQMLLAIVQRLEIKVDIMSTNAVTRVEFESLRGSMEAFLLKREFELYRESHDTWSTTVLKQLNEKMAALQVEAGAWRHSAFSTIAILISIASAVGTWFHHP